MTSIAAALTAAMLLHVGDVVDLPLATTRPALSAEFQVSVGPGLVIVGAVQRHGDCLTATNIPAGGAATTARIAVACSALQPAGELVSVTVRATAPGTSSFRLTGCQLDEAPCPTVTQAITIQPAP